MGVAPAFAMGTSTSKGFWIEGGKKQLFAGVDDACRVLKCTHSIYSRRHMLYVQGCRII